MVNTYNAIVTFEGDDLHDYLEKILLLKTFEELFNEYDDLAIVKRIIKFIAYGYSIDSEMLSMNGNTWAKVAEEIFDRVGLPDEFKEDTVHLKNDAVRICVDKFLKIQNDENWIQFITFRDLRSQMLRYSLMALLKAGGEIDINAKMDAANHSLTLLQMMNQAKETFIQNNPKLKGSVEALNKANEKAKVTRNPASYAAN